MKLQSISGLVFALVLVVVSSAYAQQSAGVLLQSGLHKEHVQGDLEAAIEVYQRVLKDFPKDRPAAAKALLHIGLCYEKMGKQEAQKAYQRLLKEFADQSDVVAEARVRLAGMVRDNGKSEVTVRRVWSGCELEQKNIQSDYCGAPSPDGRYLSFTEWDYGNLAVLDLSTRQYRDITKDGTWDGLTRWAGCSIWSPDGKQIAYAWRERLRWELRVIGLDGSQPRVLCRNEQLKAGNPYGVYPATWSQDGKHILTSFFKRPGADRLVWEIALVSAADGSVRVLKSLKAPAVHWRMMSLSPDGRHVVYAHPAEEDERACDIFLLATDGSGKEVPLVRDPADDYSPVWAPDGKTIVFVSDRSGAYDAWLIQVADGKPAGEPQLVKRDTEGMQPMGFTREGSLYYGFRAVSSDVYVASINPATGKPLAPPAKAIPEFAGRNSSPAWSPDGKSLAYVSERPSPGTSRRRTVLVIRSVENGQERELHPKAYLRNLHFSPDGRSILCGRSLQLIDVKTEDVTRLVQFDPAVRVRIRDAAWSPDGKAIYYVKEENSTSIVMHDLETGKDKQLRNEGVHYVGFALSPDGRRLAFAADERTLMVMPATGGQPRELLRLPDNERFAYRPNFTWTADGQYILYRKNWGPIELWRIPAEGGESQKLLAINDLRDVSVHPDGSRIAFVGGDHAMEVWAMENFLPESKAGE
jgi:Tol biopolymer transport system component